MVARCYLGGNMLPYGVGPHYDPELVAQLAGQEATRAITLVASDGCANLGLTNDDVWSILRALSGPACRFYKSMTSDQRPDEILDVYDVWVDNTPIYLKFKIILTHDGTRQIVVVLSFKRNEHFA